MPPRRSGWGVRTFLSMGFASAGLTVNMKLVDTEGQLFHGNFLSGLEHPWILIYTDTRYLRQPPAVTKGWLFLCFLLSVFKQKYDSHGIGVNLLKCFGSVLITTVIGALWSSNWVLELLVLTAFSWGLLGEVSIPGPRTYLQQVFLTSVLPVLFLPEPFTVLDHLRGVSKNS